MRRSGSSFLSCNCFVVLLTPWIWQDSQRLHVSQSSIHAFDLPLYNKSLHHFKSFDCTTSWPSSLIVSWLAINISYCIFTLPSKPGSHCQIWFYKPILLINVPREHTIPPQWVHLKIIDEDYSHFLSSQLPQAALKHSSPSQRTKPSMKV